MRPDLARPSSGCPTLHLSHPDRSSARRPSAFRAALSVALAAAIAVVAGPAGAQAAAPADGYPQKPIRIVVPFPAGGYSDSIGRIIAAHLTRVLGQSAVVENRPGAGGNIGADVVAKSAPDGYTLVMGTIGTHAINPALYRKIPYDAIKDFAPIAFVADAETVLVVNPSVPARSVAELVALAKSKPDGLTFASGGAGTTGHLAGELFRSAAGVPLIHVPYKGNAPAMTDLVAGQVMLSFATLQTALPHIKAGKLNALATLGTTRSPTLPELPTLTEAGVGGVEVRNWTGLFAPAGTPATVGAKIAAEVDTAMRSPEVQQKLRNEGLAYTSMGPAPFGAFVAAEADRWAKVVKASGASVD